MSHHHQRGPSSPSGFSLGLSAPNTPQSALSDYSFVVSDSALLHNANSSIYHAASALDTNISYQEQLKETLMLIEMNLIENRLRQQEIIESLLNIELEKEEDGPVATQLTVKSIKPPFFKSRSYPKGPPPNAETLKIRHECVELQRPMVTNLKRLDWTASDRRLLCNAVRQQCLALYLQPLFDRKSTLENKLDSLNPYEWEERTRLSTELNQIDIEVDTHKEKNFDDEFIIGHRLRTDIDWVYIAVNNFSNQRDASDCKLQWQNYLHPSVNKSKWSPEEINKLFHTVQTHQAKQPFVTAMLASSGSVSNEPKNIRYIDWRQIAILHGNKRTIFDCFSCYMQRLILPTGWRDAELRLLKKMTARFTVQSKVSWTHVAEFFDGRSPLECAEKFKKMMTDKLRLGRWSPDEDVILLKAVDKYGIGRWSKVALEVPDRSDRQCRERYLFRLSGAYIHEPWTKAADETLVDLIIKHGPTTDCAIIAENTLQKQRKEIYQRFRHLVDTYTKGDESMAYVTRRGAPRRAQLLERAEKLREKTISDQVIEMHNSILKNSKNDGKTFNVPTFEKRNLTLRKPATTRYTKNFKFIDKLKLLAPDLIDPTFLKSEIKRSLPAFRHPLRHHGGSRLERVDNSLDEFIFSRCLSGNRNQFGLNPNLPNEDLSPNVHQNQQQLGVLMAQLMTLLKVDYCGALRMLQLKSNKNFINLDKHLVPTKTPKPDVCKDPTSFLCRVRKALDEGNFVVDLWFKPHLSNLYEIRFHPCVQEVIMEYACMEGNPPYVISSEVTSYPTCMVLPTPIRTDGSLSDNSDGEECGENWDELDGVDDTDDLIKILQDDGKDNSMPFDILSPAMSENSNSNLTTSKFENSENFSKFFESDEPNGENTDIAEKFDPNLPTKVLLKKFGVKKDPKSKNEENRQRFLNDYGSVLAPGTTSPHVQVLLQNPTKSLTILIHGNLILQLVNVETNQGLRTLVMPIARLPFPVNAGGRSVHILPDLGTEKKLEVLTFESLERSQKSVQELLEKCRSQKALEKANVLLNKAVGRTFMTTDEKVKFQDWVKQLPAQTYPQNLSLPLVPPNSALFDLWSKIMHHKANILCRGLVCYKHARHNRPLMRLARKVFENNAKPFKYKLADIAFQLALYCKVDSNRLQSAVHRLLYQPIKSVPEFSALEKTWEVALVNNNDTLMKLHARLFDRSERVQSILEEIKSTPVYQLFRSRLFSLLLLPVAMSSMPPTDLSSVLKSTEELNNNIQHKNFGHADDKPNNGLFKYLNRRRVNKPREAFLATSQPSDVDLSCLMNLQKQLQTELTAANTEEDANLCHAQVTVSPSPLDESYSSGYSDSLISSIDNRNQQEERVVMLDDYLGPSEPPADQSTNHSSPPSSITTTCSLSVSFTPDDTSTLSQSCQSNSEIGLREKDCTTTKSSSVKSNHTRKRRKKVTGCTLEESLQPNAKKKAVESGSRKRKFNKTTTEEATKLKKAKLD